MLLLFILFIICLSQDVRELAELAGIPVGQFVFEIQPQDQRAKEEWNWLNSMIDSVDNSLDAVADPRNVKETFNQEIGLHDFTAS